MNVCNGMEDENSHWEQVQVISFTEVSWGKKAYEKLSTITVWYILWRIMVQWQQFIVYVQNLAQESISRK